MTGYFSSTKYHLEPELEICGDWGLYGAACLPQHSVFGTKTRTILVTH